MKKRAFAILVCTLSLVGACQAKLNANARVSASQKDEAPPKEETPSGAWSGESEPAPATPPAPVKSEPVVAAVGPTGSALCPLTCLVPAKGRIAAAEEQRLADALAPTMQEIHACVRGRASLTLRFDGTSALTHFGIDSDEDSPCLASLRDRRPPVSMAGPVTLRCTEHCGRR